MNLRLRDLLAHPEAYSSSDRLYLSFEESWTLDTECLLFPVSDIDGVPVEAASKGVDYVVGLDVIQDVVANAKGQKPSATLEELLEAFVFYYDNDAFLALEES